jgi:hypothetical protein
MDLFAGLPENGVRKAIFRDPDGNEVGLGGGPQQEP